MPKRIDYDQSTQAGRIIAKFGSATALSRALRDIGTPRSVATICRWTYPKNKYGGRSTTSGGSIPNHIMPAILQAARLWGIIFTSEELRP